MQTEQTCGTCRYFDAEFLRERVYEPKDRQARFGVCRRHAPTPSVAEMLRRMVSGLGTEDVVHGVYPEMRYTDWCGDWDRSGNADGH